MSEIFCFHVEPDQNLITATLSGFWSEADVASYKRALTDARSKLAGVGKPPSGQRFLLDMTRAEVQSQAVINKLRQLAQDPNILEGRIAIVAPASLARLQVKRASQAKHVGFFHDRPKHPIGSRMSTHVTADPSPTVAETRVAGKGLWNNNGGPGSRCHRAR